MLLIAGGVLLFIGLPLIVTMIAGVVELVEMIYHLFRALYLLVRHTRIRRVQHEPATPKRKATAKSSKRTTPTDPDLAKIRGMAKVWKSQGQAVGLVNLATGEVFEPASDEQGG